MLKISKEELPKTLFEISDFFKLEKVVHFLSDQGIYNGISEESILNSGIDLLDLKNDKSELKKWFKDECCIFNEIHIIIFINEYIKNIDTFDLNKNINNYQRIISMVEPEYKLKLRQFKINKIKYGI